MSTNFILGFVFLLLACGLSVIRKTYFEVPLSELKKRRALGEEIHNEITSVLGYGPALRALLWLLLGLTMSASVTLLSRSLTVWLSVIFLSLAIFLVFSYLPSTKISRFDKRLALLVSPSINWVLKRTAKYLNKIHSPIEKHYKMPVSPIYDSQDLHQLIKNLSKQGDHRIESELLLNLERSFDFDNHRVGDLMMPSKKIKKLLESDVIGPILINDLHEAPEGYALVREQPKGDITGILVMGDLSIRSQGNVGAHMQKELHYVSQTSSSLSVIKAFFETRSNFYIVLDENNKFVGVISLASVLKRLTGPLDFIDKDIDVPHEDVAKTD